MTYSGMFTFNGQRVVTIFIFPRLQTFYRPRHGDFQALIYFRHAQSLYACLSHQTFSMAMGVHQYDAFTAHMYLCQIPADTPRYGTS